MSASLHMLRPELRSDVHACLDRIADFERTDAWLADLASAT